MKYPENAVLVVGQAKPSRADAIYQTHGEFYISLVVERDTGRILDMTCNTILDVTAEFVRDMCGALLCGVVFWKSRNLPATLAGEVLGTGVIGGLCAYPIATMFMGVDAAAVAFYAYIIPFLISTAAGSILAGLLVFALQKSGALNSMRATLER